MRGFHKFTFKLTAYVAFLLYLVGDLYVWDGFLSGRIREHFKPMENPFGDTSDVVARVYGEPITQNQLERRKLEIAYVRGWLRSDDSKGIDALPSQQQETLRIQALYDLIESALLRLKTRANDMRLPDVSQQARVLAEGVKTRFPQDASSYQQALDVQRMNPDIMEGKIAARLKQNAMLARGTDAAVAVPESEIQFYYERVREKIKIPKRRSLRHIFIATLGKSPDEAKAKIDAAGAALAAGASFEDCAARYSEDERTAAKGGNLGVVTADRPGLQGVDLFALPEGTPTLAQSNLGWHLFLAGPVMEERVPTYEEAQGPIRAALESARRERAVGLYADQLRQEAHAGKRIVVAGRS